MDFNSLDLYVFKAFCTKVVDGDTVDLTIDMGFRNTTEQRIRLSGIDTPERGEPGWAEARHFLELQLLDQPCYVKSYKTDVFGRWLGDLYIEHALNEFSSVNEAMKTNGFAKTYKER